jgi:hypothetical protein
VQCTLQGVKNTINAGYKKDKDEWKSHYREGKTHIGEEIHTTEREIEIHPADDNTLQGRRNIQEKGPKIISVNPQGHTKGLKSGPKDGGMGPKSTLCTHCTVHGLDRVWYTIQMGSQNHPAESKSFYSSDPQI